MKHNWTFGQQAVPAMIAGRNIQEILIDYDGPQLTVLKKGEDLYLALCIDEDGNISRWIQTPISRLEYDALMRGALPVRGALLKPEMILVDMVDGRDPQHVWELDPAKVPDKVLPKSGAMLPEYVRTSFRGALQPGIPATFRLGGRGILADRIPFAGLGQITERLQQLWDTIAKFLGTPPATLNAVGLVPGSLEVQVNIDNTDVFARVAHTYSELTRASYEQTQLFDLLAEKPPRVKKKYSNYLKALADYKIDVLTEWHEGVAFIGAAGASKAWQALEPPPEEHKITILELVGYLAGYAGKRHFFEFLEVGDQKRRLWGTLDNRLINIPVRQEVRLGPTTTYRVTIEELQIGDQEPKYTLKSFTPTPD